MHVEGMGDASPPGSPLSSWTGSQCCSLDYWTLQPTPTPTPQPHTPPHPHAPTPLPPHPRPRKCPCLSRGVSIRPAAGQGAAGAQRLREQEREWGCGFSQHSMLSPLSLGSLGEGPPCSLQGHRHCYLEPTRPGYASTFATFLPSPFSVATRLPMFFSGHHSPALLVSICFSVSLSFLSYSLPFSEIFLPVFLCLSLLL